MHMTVAQALEGISAVFQLAQSRTGSNDTLSRRIADENEIVRLYRASVGGGDGYRDYSPPCYSHNGTMGAECGRANVRTTSDRAKVCCTECISLIKSEGY